MAAPKIPFEKLRSGAIPKARARAKAIFLNTTERKLREVIPPDVRWALLIFGACVILSIFIRWLRA